MRTQSQPDDPATRRQTDIGELIQRHRLERGLSREKLAERIQLDALDAPTPTEIAMHPRTIENWERKWPLDKKPNIPSLSLLQLVARALRFAPDSPEYRELFRVRLASERDVARRFPRKQRGGTTGSVAVTPRIPEPATPFIAAGRQGDLDTLLHDAARITTEDATIGITLVSGSPGLGKSMLLRAFAERAIAAHDALVVVRAAATEELTADGLLPLRQILAQLLGLAAETPRGALAERQMATANTLLRALVERDVPIAEWPVSATLLQDLLTHPALSESARAHLGTRLQAAPAARSIEDVAARWADAIIACATERPTVLILEDLHWANLATTLALQTLLDRLAEHPTLPLQLTLSFRPADIMTTPTPHARAIETLLTTISRSTTLPLTMIDLQHVTDDASARAFVRAMVEREFPTQTVSPSFIAELTAHTNGVPLFVTWMLHHLREQGILTAMAEQGPAVLRKIDWTSLPQELSAILQRQRETLSPDEQRLLSWASIQGETFSEEPLLDALGIPRDIGHEILATQLAERHGLITTHGIERDGEVQDHRWTFTHALVRDFMRSTLSLFERRRAHLLTADALIAIHGEHDHWRSERIAWHLEQSGDLHRAATAWVRAGDYCMAMGDMLTAARLFAHVETINAATEHPPMLVQSYLGRANTARALGDVAEATRFATQGITHARSLGNPQVLANALQTASTVTWDRGQHEEGIALLTEAREIMATLDNLVEQCRVEFLIALNLIVIGHYDRATEHATAALQIAQRMDPPNPRMLITALVGLGNVHLELGQYEAAIARYQQGIELAREPTLTQREALCALNIGIAHIELGNEQHAIRMLRRVHEIGREVPVLDYVNQAHFSAGMLAEAQGRYAIAEREYARSLEIRDEIGQRALAIDSVAGLLLIALDTHQRARVIELLTDIEGRIARHGRGGSEYPTRLFAALYRAYRYLGRTEQATQVAQDARAWFRDRLAHIPDPADQQSFLTRVPANRDLLQLIERVPTLPAKIGTPAIATHAR